MDENREYEIAFVGLKNGEHRFTYSINNKFFLSFGSQEFSDPSLEVVLIFEKNFGLFRLKFEILGQVTVNCDRCWDRFRLNVWDEFLQIVKQVEDPQKLKGIDSTEIGFISRKESHLNVATWIYEFSLLSIPMQRIHPDLPDGTSGCNPDVINRLNFVPPKMPQKGENPIWKDLNQFRDH